MRLRMRSSIIASICLAAGIASSDAFAQGLAASAPTDPSRGVLSYASIVEPVIPGVVSVHVRSAPAAPAATGNPTFDRLVRSSPPEERKADATGFVIDAANGLIVTGSTALENVKEVSVTLADGREYAASIVGRDAETDLALLKIRAEKLHALTWGDSNTVRVGDVVFAIGHPARLENIVTAGVVSGFTRNDERTNYRQMIVSDARIGPGQSGGPLIDSKGRVIAVTGWIFAGQNIMLSVSAPAAEARRVIDNLRAFGRVKRASLGVQVVESYADHDLTNGLQANATEGLLIEEIVPDSSAEKAGLRVGDVILRVGGRPMTSAMDLRAFVRESAVGATTEIAYRREGREQTVAVALGETSSDTR